MTLWLYLKKVQDDVNKCLSPASVQNPNDILIFETKRQEGFSHCVILVQGYP